MDLAESQSCKEPLVLVVAVAVLDCSESVGHALGAVDDGAGEIVGWVNFPF